MLTLGKLALGQQAYYLDQVAKGAEEYYSEGKESPGEWTGRAAKHLSLAGEVDGDELARLLAHVDPSGVYRLTGSRSVPTVAAFDATFCAPKSVSLLYALGDREISNEVRNAADTAVAEALNVYETVASRVRRGQGGHTVLDADGFVAASFRHRTSRAGDPHLHTHVVVANLAHEPVAGKWSALDGRPLYQWASTIGHLHEAQLRWELTRRLGVEWGPVRNGIADLRGISSEAIREFSTRRREIEAHLAEHGVSGAKAAQAATYATRQAKRLEPVDGLTGEWRVRAERVGLDETALAGIVDRVPTRAITTQPDIDALFAALGSPTGLTAKRSTFGEREVIRAICNALPAGAPVHEILDLAEAFLRSEHVVRLNVVREPGIQRSDGTTVAGGITEARYTTPELLSVEADLLTSAERRRADRAGVATADGISRALAARPTITREQAAMVERICGSGDGIDVVEGVAGSGKTFALAAARDAWEASGFQVFGCALAARAAQQLEADAGIRSATIDRLLRSIDDGLELNERRVLVVDEAGMVGTRTLARLLAHAEVTGAKVVLVGDRRQLPEIDAGGAFAGLATRLGAVTLQENRRQQLSWERDALAGLRAGHADDVLDAYLTQGRVHEHVAVDDARSEVIHAWAASRDRQEDVVMLASRSSDVEDLNRRARQHLQERGRLDGDEVRLGGRGYSVGDEILVARNNRSVGVVNGTRGTVTGIDERRGSMQMITRDGQCRRLPFQFVRDHVQHGYAMTTYKAQGATVDRCLVLTDERANREQLYTAMSRGRLSNDLYLVRDDARIDEQHARELQPDTRDQLRAAVVRSSAQHLAADQLPEARRADELREERDGIRNRIGYGPPDVEHEHRQLEARRAREVASLNAALDRRDRAVDKLESIRGLGRLVHRSDVDDLRRTIADCDRQIQAAGVNVHDLDRAITGLQPAVDARAAWCAEHADDLTRITELDVEIHRAEITERLQRRAVERALGGPEIDFGR